jgi:hypothetical protein
LRSNGLLICLMVVAACAGCGGESPAVPAAPAPTPAPTPTPVPAPATIKLEAESGSGAGQIMPRSAASGERTVLLKSGESRLLQFDLSSPASYAVTVRYSNDNFGALESVAVAIDGSALGSFQAEDTGDEGSGWNVFAWSPVVGTVRVAAASHTLAVSVSGGDGYGVEIDHVTLTRTD